MAKCIKNTCMLFKCNKTSDKDSEDIPRLNLNCGESYKTMNL